MTFTTLKISRNLPIHTQTWLAWLDSTIIERVGINASERIAEARRQEKRTRRLTYPANAAYFLSLYATMLANQSHEETVS